jgi:hypothetical protein
VSRQLQNVPARGERYAGRAAADAFVATIARSNQDINKA